ncbi:putative ankyrin-3 [Rosellinia necatrix]|uniref:Putative ankyrin-3 n=1 Tax=Rosellinia necatrix TaxID=77044 RepID=A0A1S8A7V0_ROSNE|nr:putative ankyrin-3 [Rosellinia necatrix]
MRQGWTGEANTVIWTLEENEDKSDGIPSFLRAAVLLRRQHNVPFSFTVKVKTNVDFVGKVKTLFGLERKDPIDPVEIGPAQFPEPRHVSIRSLDPKLHNLAKMDRLDLRKVAKVMLVTVLDGDSLAKVEDSDKVNGSLIRILVVPNHRLSGSGIITQLSAYVQEPISRANCGREPVLA